MELRDPYFHNNFNGLRECAICIYGRLPKRKKLLVYYPASRIIRSRHCYNYNIIKEL